jgi:hypothetical protein
MILNNSEKITIEGWKCTVGTVQGKWRVQLETERSFHLPMSWNCESKKEAIEKAVIAIRARQYAESPEGLFVDSVCKMIQAAREASKNNEEILARVAEALKH